jgi:ABC-2 type transport system permease protein
MTSLVRRGLRDSRRALVWWSAGIVAYVVLICAVWPSVRDNPALKNLHETYPEALKAFVSFGGEFDFSTGAGYLGAELFSLVIPLILLIAAIGAGARALAGEEEAGTLDLLLANPVSRTQVAMAKLVIVIAEILVISVVLWGALWASSAIFGLGVDGAHLLGATASAALLAIAFGALATAVAAGTGRRAIAITACAAIALAGYLVNALAPLVSGLNEVRWISPWHHYAASDPLRHGLGITHVLALMLLLVVAAVALPIVFGRRDLH